MSKFPCQWLVCAISSQLLLFFYLPTVSFFSCHFIHTAAQMNCYLFSCFFFPHLPTVTFFPVTFFPTCSLLLSFLLLFFLLVHCYFLSCYFFSCYFFSYLKLLLSFLLTFFLLLSFRAPWSPGVKIPWIHVPQAGLLQDISKNHECHMVLFKNKKELKPL